MAGKGRADAGALCCDGRILRGVVGTGDAVRCCAVGCGCGCGCLEVYASVVLEDAGWRLHSGFEALPQWQGRVWRVPLRGGRNAAAANLQRRLRQVPAHRARIQGLKPPHCVIPPW